jgi:hypothetical protein
MALRKLNNEYFDFSADAAVLDTGALIAPVLDAGYSILDNGCLIRDMCW